MNSWTFAQPVHADPHDHRGQMLRAGAGARITSNAIGAAVSVPNSPARPGDAFRPSLSGRGVSLSRGYIAGRMPTINDVPIAPNDGRAIPVLTLDKGNANERGESFVCVEVHPDDQGALPKESKIEIVERTEPRSLDRSVGRLALAIVIWRAKRPFTVFHLVRFNCGYERVLPPDGGGAVKHLWP